MMLFDGEHLSLPIRSRRLRKESAVRDLVRECKVQPSDLVQPLFVAEGSKGESEPIESMPGQRRLPIADLVEHCKYLGNLGLRAVALFPKVAASRKDAKGTEALNPDALILRAIKEVKAAVPELVVFADVALDPYTDHGHDGILTSDGSDVDNDPTVAALCQMAVLNAQAGADFIAPSDMMDGRIGAIRKALDVAALQATGILAYSTKFASAFYGPFRDAVGSQKTLMPTISKKTYQLDPANRRLAILKGISDESEGADILMVKPAGSYLDILRDLRTQSLLPLAAYQVSGEYAQLHAAGQAGWLDLKAARDESLLCIKRAGADIIISYFAEAFLQEFSS